MTAPGRGRPTILDATKQHAYLALVADGTRLGAAAAQVGIDRRTVTYLAHRDTQFAQQLADAKARGKQARIPHGDPDGYDNHNCRCTPCTKASTDARAGRRERAASGEVVPLPEPPEPASPLALANVS